MDMQSFYLKREFPLTEWTQIRRATDPDTEGALHALETVLHNYLPALKAHLVGVKKVPPGKADDLVQGFIADQILKGELLTKTDREKGRFRNFLLTAFDRYVISVYRKDTAAKRVPEGGMGQLDEALQIPHSGIKGSETFDVEWVKQVIAQSLDRVESNCSTSGRHVHWLLFHRRVIGPVLEGAAQPGYAELMEELGFESPLQASNALLTVKRMFQREFRAVISEYCDSETELEEEICNLNAILATGSANLQ